MQAAEEVLFDLEAAAYLLRYPEGEWWDVAPNILRLVADGDVPTIRQALQTHLQEAFAAMAADGVEAAQEEYTRLFISDLPYAPCRPVEAFYLEEAGAGQSTSEVAGTYEKHGVTAQELPPDHVVSELAFLGHLLLRGDLQAMTDAAAFGERHLLEWLPKWVAGVAQHARQPFYAKAAAYALAAVKAAQDA